MKTEFPVSKKIYALLLHAFPKTHRDLYGAAMAQLFRDQCRDAWTEAGNFGLLKLWLRALTDLAGSSIMERLAALKERKTMNDKLGDLSTFQNYSPGKTFVRVFVVVFLIVVFVSTVVTFILPETYASTATIKVERETPAPPAGHIDSMVFSDPYFMQTTFEIMKSELVLTNVISALNLNDAWGRKYNGGNVLKTTETMEILKDRMTLAPVGNTKLISITVYSEDPKEAAQIANQITKAYQNYRVQMTEHMKADGFRVLEAQLSSQSNQLQAASSATGIEDRRQNYDALLAEVKQARLENQLPVYTVVQVTDPAEPAKAPIRPNRPLNITIGVVGGILLASVIGMLVLVAKAIVRRKAGTASA